MGQSVQELKAALRQRGIDFSACREKWELQQLLQQAVEREEATAADKAAEPEPHEGENLNRLESEELKRSERFCGGEDHSAEEASVPPASAAPAAAATEDTRSSESSRSKNFSVAALKQKLSALGVDFSACREKGDLIALLEKAEAECPPASALADGGFARHVPSDRLCWVEFVTDGDALCHWDDGADAIVSESALDVVEHLPGPVPHSGSFEEARAHAFRSNLLLVAAVTGKHGDNIAASKPEATQALALASEEIVQLLESNAVFWSGPVASLRGPHVMQLAPKGAPSLCMVLPLAEDAMKVLSCLQCDSKEKALEAFLAALEAQDEHRQAHAARMASDTALLRQAQDDEYMAALAADQEAQRAAAAAAAAQEADADSPLAATAEADEAAIAAAVAEAAESDRKRAQEEEQAERLAKSRKLMADEFLESPSTTTAAEGSARLVLRLPSGGRVARSFSATDTFGKVRRWAECCAWLPEANGQELIIPAEFELSTSYPPRRFSADDEEKSLQELGLAPSAALLLIDTST